jgi:hypothetical protein
MKKPASGRPAGLPESFSRRTTPSLRDVMAEIGRILFCSLGLAAVLEIFARVAGFK